MLKSGILHLCGEDTTGWNEQFTMLTSYEQQAAEAAAASLTPGDMGLEQTKLRIREDFRYVLTARRSNNGKT
ncbi:hypothetical protein KFL_002730180 [Klebsormidium nitens]|uniref:Uncharacterized protein n=1 Tax=Klebsormidium nitens TaxID=105231 RepID=A0A1Y1I5D2_KLENI|nr:hypothetical protein KFL_002730180 [Klebsormidium nitens]|eukprot:GAQ86160.1 hypothetical protein KFL_002730180 [Klebsormidium nitens]